MIQGETGTSRIVSLFKGWIIERSLNQKIINLRVYHVSSLIKTKKWNKRRIYLEIMVELVGFATDE